MGAPLAKVGPGTRPSLTLRRGSRTPRRAGNSSGCSSSLLSKSKWDEGVSVVQSLLQPGSATYQAMTPEQRHGLQQVEMLLLQGIGGGTGTNQVSTMSHIPTELIRMESETATANLENSNYKYLMKEFGGVQESTAIRKVRTAVLASTWAKHVHDRSSRRNLNSRRPILAINESTPIITTGNSRDSVKSYTSGSGGENFASLMSLMSEDDYVGGPGQQPRSIPRCYTPPEFSSLDREVQTRIYCDYLNWDSLKRRDFNIFELTQLCKGHPLLLVGWALLASPNAQTAMRTACGFEDDSKNHGGEGYKFCETFNIPQETLCDYLRVIEGDYNSDNPYHNEIHGADVIQTAHALLQMNKMVLTSTTPKDQCTTTAMATGTTKNDGGGGDDCDDAIIEVEEVEELLQLNDLEKFSFLLAAAVHDVGHPGRNNSFQINRQTNLAMDYNDLSVLEHMHVSKAFRLMFQVKDVRNTIATNRNLDNESLGGSPLPPPPPSSILPSFSPASGSASMRDIIVPDSPAMTHKILGQIGVPAKRVSTFQEPYNILRNMETEDITKVRKMTIEAVLHTDMSNHFADVSKMKGLVLSTSQQQQQQQEDEMAEGDTDGDDDDDADETKGTTSNASASFQQHISTQLKDGSPWEVLCFMLHLADISNPAKPQPMLTDWTDRCLEEFFAQGDDEAKLGLPISPNCDRATTQRADSQIGFIKFVILPAYEVLAEFLPAVGDGILPIIEANLLYWTEIKTKEEDSTAETAAAARAELQAIEKNRRPQIVERKIPDKSGGGGESAEGKTTTMMTKVTASNFLSKFNRNKARTEGGERYQDSSSLSSDTKDITTEETTATAQTAEMTNFLAQRDTSARVPVPV